MELIQQVIAWGEEKGIFETSSPAKQLLKSASELGEVCDAVAKVDSEALEMEVGDFIVTLILYSKMRGFDIDTVFKLSKESRATNSRRSIARVHRDFSSLLLCELNYDANPYNFFALCEQLALFCLDADIDPKDCLQRAYDKISKRKGSMVNGVFVKVGSDEEESE